MTVGFTVDITMIKSMTGFGRSEIVRDEHRLTVEMKSVNHRYLDLNIKMPKKFNAYEAEIRNILKEYLQRGKVDLFISYQDFSGKNVNVNYNSAIATEYMNYLSQMAEEFQIPNDVTTSSLSRYPEVFTMEETEEEPEEALPEMIREALIGACTSLVEARSREGENLKKDLLAKLNEMLANVAFIEARSPQIVEEYKEKLHKRMEELLEGSQADENRLLTEVFFAKTQFFPHLPKDTGCGIFQLSSFKMAACGTNEKLVRDLRTDPVKAEDLTFTNEIYGCHVSECDLIHNKGHRPLPQL